jgi:hypothetical protein
MKIAKLADIIPASNRMALIVNAFARTASHSGRHTS